MLTIRYLLRHPIVIVILVSLVFGSVSYFYIKYLNGKVDLLNDLAKNEVVKSVSKEIYKNANKRLEKINEINISDNNGSISFDGLFK